MSTRKALTALTSSLVNQSAQIKHYNFRSYFMRISANKAKFVQGLSDADLAAQQDSLLATYQKDLDQLERITIVQNLYYSDKPNVLEKVAQ
mmetsp:Transcript_34645/g.53004  ORF Transcript_34645/g.53004 Transcript_34645/m.53004 type:complete len:91 (+) Transcript_34645:26-298(+)